jgi:16S rRNA (cytosine1402-N4)-methyltransferase
MPAGCRPAGRFAPTLVAHGLSSSPPETEVTAAGHDPVMVERVTALLATDQPGVLVDATIGPGGHAAALLSASGPATRLVGLDRDAAALEMAHERLADHAARLTLVHAAFDELGDVLDDIAPAEPVRAVLYDLGMSSLQLDRAERGFSLSSDAPLDMRMDPTSGEPASALLDRLNAQELAALLRDYGEERHARRIAHAIVAARPIRRTGQLVEAVTAAVPARARAGPRPVATRTFQALRIAVNDELTRFRASLPQALERLTPAPGSSARSSQARAGPEPGDAGGRLAVLAYHSLEDRIAKQTLAEAARGCICPPGLPVCGCGREPTVRLLTAGAERPAATEVAANPRSRSARLRAAERTAASLP